MRQRCRHRGRPVAGVFLAVLLCSGVSLAEDIPAKLMPPAGTRAIGAYQGKGVQIYVCAAQGATNLWKFKAPEAQLRAPDGAVFGKHYAGPTWEAVDGSKIVGTVIQSVPAPAAGAVPWLLLSAQSSGQGALSDVRFVQRVKTDGGASPSGPCPAPGAEQRVPYTAEYIFYR